MRRHMLAFVLVLLLGAVATAAAAENTSFRVTSSLDGKRVLPLRSHWLVYPKVPSGKIKEVDFLIDGKLRWIEHESPYNYGSDDFHGHLGFLITTWLTPGLHRFSAVAKASDGRTGKETVTARVLPAPSPPAEIAGTWERTVTAGDLEKGDPNDGPPAGEWHLVFDRVGAWHLDPLGSGVVNQYDVQGDVIHVYAPIVMAPFSDGKGGVSRFGHHGIGGNDCREDGPFGSYNWSVSGNHLTLKTIDEGCGNRRAIWEGTWTRAS
jgi:hypothetical protein